MTTTARTGAPAASPTGPDLVGGLIQLSFNVQAILGRLAEQQGLSVTQVHMLAVLADRDLGMRQLAGVLELEKSSVTGLVDRAERRGLVRRVAVPDNRRAIHVTLTPTGRSLVQAACDAARIEITALTATLSTTQRAHLGRSVDSLVRACGARSDVPRPDYSLFRADQGDAPCEGGLSPDAKARAGDVSDHADRR